jgi:hypothetical protein
MLSGLALVLKPGHGRSGSCVLRYTYKFERKWQMQLRTATAT